MFQVCIDIRYDIDNEMVNWEFSIRRGIVWHVYIEMYRIRNSYEMCMWFVVVMRDERYEVDNMSCAWGGRHERNDMKWMRRVARYDALGWGMTPQPLLERFWLSRTSYRIISKQPNSNIRRYSSDRVIFKPECQEDINTNFSHLLLA